MDDSELIRAVRENESYAGPFLVSLYGPRLAGYCRSIAPDLGDTDRELAIENGIERAVRRIEAYEPDRGSVLAWLRPFVLHATQDWRRSNVQLSRYDSADLVDVAAPSPVDVIQPPAPESAQAAEAVRTAFRQLSVPDQVVIVLRNYEQHPVQHTAEILGISVDACRQRHHRALTRLKAFLEADERVTPMTGGDDR